MKNDYAQRQAAWIEKYNITIGSKVRVVRAAEDFEDGWADSWEAPLTKLISKTTTVTEIYSEFGILLDAVGCFPYFVLEPVTEPATPSTDGNAPASEMTKREVMAMAAMQGMLARATLVETDGERIWNAVEWADDLIAELNKTEVLCT